MGKVRTRGAALLLVAVALACALAGLAGCSGENAKGSPASGKALRVGVRSDVVGFGYLNEGTGKYYGLEIDIAEEMAARMGYGSVEFVTVTPDTRKDMLVNGEVDCIRHHGGDEHRPAAGAQADGVRLHVGRGAGADRGPLDDPFR